jgi:hypothetical protein
MLSCEALGWFDEGQSCAMEQVLILALGVFPAAGEDQHRGVQAGDVEPTRCVGETTTSTRRTLPAGCFASRCTGHGN